MPRCFFCDTQNADTATNCTSCGASLQTDKPATPVEPSRPGDEDLHDDDLPGGGPWPQLTDQQIEGIAGELKQGRKIQAIKLLRETTGMGLKEAKDAVEALARQRGLPGGGGGGCAGVVLCMLVPVVWAALA